MDSFEGCVKSESRLSFEELGLTERETTNKEELLSLPNVTNVAISLVTLMTYKVLKFHSFE